MFYVERRRGKEGGRGLVLILISLTFASTVPQMGFEAILRQVRHYCIAREVGG
jgi:hypothetical protein